MNRAFPPIRPHTLLAVCATAAATICAVILLGGQILIKSFDTIDKDEARDLAARAERALDDDLGRMSVSVLAYSRWDGFRDLLRHGDFKPLREQFSSAQLESMKVSVVAVFTADGKPLFSEQFDANLRSVTAVDPDLLGLVQSQFAAMLIRRPMHERIIRGGSGLFVFSMTSIKLADGSDSGLMLFFARPIDVGELERARDAIQAPVDLILRGRDGRFDGIDDADTLRWIEHSPPAERFFTRAVDDRSLNTYVLLRDFKGERVALLAMQRARDIYLLGRHTTWMLLGILLALLVSACAALFFLFSRLQRSMTAHDTVKYRYTNLAAHLKETIVLAEAHSGRVVEANASLAQALGYSAQEIKELNLGNIYPGLSQLRSSMHQAPQSSSIQECRMLAKDGRGIDVEVTLTRVRESGTEFLCVLGRDITLRKQAEQQAAENRRKLSYLANHDSLTSLPNRLFLQTRLPRLLRKLADSKRLLAVFYVDVDHFKNVNDLHGHSSGDQLLRVFAKRLKAATGSHDIVIRMGGDEFVVIASLLPDLAAVENIAQRLVGTAQAPIVLDGMTVAVGASIGVSVYPNDGLDAESLLKHADIALYQAKENGRNGYKIFTSNMDVAVSEHVALEQALRHALGTEQLFVEYQPVVNLMTGQLESFEALLRWRHPEIGYVPPMRFIPIAEKSGMIIELGGQVLRMVCTQLRAWLDQDVPLAPVAINISPLQLRRVPLSTLVHELTFEFDLDPKLLHFEITESAMVQQSQDLFVTLQTLRELGSKVSIDDFGTGFSNLSYLKHMPIDTIKIDKAFVQDVARDESDAAIVSGIVSMARQLRLRTVAEGIETAEQHVRLRELGCMYGQGYYFSKPIEPERCKALLQELGVQRRLTDTVKLRAFSRA